METLEIPDEHRDRIETLRSELADEHAGAYATVDTDDVLAYLLDLAEAVDDPGRTADPVDGSTTAEAVEESAVGPSTAETGDTTDDPGSDGGDGSGTFGTPFDREAVRERLADRNRKHGDPDETDGTDLYTMAATFDVAGRSEMTKDALIDAILDRATAFATDPFEAIGVDVAVDEDSGGEGNEDGDGEEAEDADDEDADDEDAGNEDVDNADTAADDDGTTQLNAMMSLLNTHDDKWREGDGDVRYEVDLPDGSVETARTKDDVRALLFKNY